MATERRLKRVVNRELLLQTHRHPEGHDVNLLIGREWVELPDGTFKELPIAPYFETMADADAWLAGGPTPNN